MLVKSLIEIPKRGTKDGEGNPLDVKTFQWTWANDNLSFIRVVQAPESAQDDNSLVYTLWEDDKGEDGDGLRKKDTILDAGQLIHIPKGHWLRIENRSRKKTAKIQALMYGRKVQ